MRIGLGIGIGFGGAAAFDPSQLSGLVGYYHADDYAAQPFSSRLADNSGSGKVLSTTGSASSPTYAANQVGGRAGLSLDSTGNKRLKWSSVSDGRFLHDGTGCTVVTISKPTLTSAQNSLLDTSNTTGIGFMLAHDGTNDRWQAIVRNGGGAILTLNGANGTSPEGSPYFTAFRYQEGLSPEAVLTVDAVDVATGSTSGAPSTGVDPVGALALSMTTSATSRHFGGYVHAVLIFNRYLSDAEIALLRANAYLLTSRRVLRRVWTIGDSMTAWTYQKNLWVRAHASSGKMIELLGTLNGGATESYSDLSHNGHTGQRLDQILTSVTGASLGATPDDILVMGGANDVTAGASEATIEARWDALIDYLRATYPAARVWLGRLPRRLDAEAADTATFAAFIPTYAAANGLDYVDTDVNADGEISVDNIHPSTAGYDVIGGKWATALGF